VIPQLAGGHADTLIAVDLERGELLWARPGTYINVFAADLISGISGQEVACLDCTRHCLDIRSLKGQLLATTTPFEGNPADVKILGPEDPDFCYLAVRDGQTVRFYRFGAPTSGDLDDFKGSITERTELRITPEPVRGALHLELSVPLRTQATLVVFNILGREVARQEIPAMTRTAAVRLDGVAAGLYFVRLDTEPRIHVKKFVLLH
jgi:hypothetical protein